MNNLNTPIYRAKNIDTNEYHIGNYNQWIQDGILYHSIIEVGNYPSPFSNIFIIDISTIAIQIGKRKLFMSLDIKAGKGGDKISDSEVLVWNDEMMNCSILEIDGLVGLCEYEINLDNCDFDKMQVIGIQK